VILAPPVAAAQIAGDRTGALLVLLDRSRASAAASAPVRADIARLGATPAGRSVPQIGLVTVQPPSGVSTAAFARRLRALPGVASVAPERRYVPRSLPDDPALTATDPAAGVPWQWYLLAEDFPKAWAITDGTRALVGVVDSGIDASHPELSSKLAMAPRDQQGLDSSGPAGTDQLGHGTNVASIACAATGNGIGIASAGDGCRLLVEKTDFTDSSIEAAIADAADHHVGALNLSFGPDPQDASTPAPAAEVRALRYAAAHRVVVVAAAADSPTSEQGDPANVLQPAGTGSRMSKGLGIDVTAAQWGGARAPFAGYGGEISLAAHGAFEPSALGSGPCQGPRIGILGAFPSNPTALEASPHPGACRVTLNGDDRYATVAGTSVAAPQVSATAAMMRALNPYASVRDVIRTLKRTAQRPPHSSWTAALGWGVLDAGAAVDAIRHLDRLAPVSQLTAARAAGREEIALSWTGHDRRRRGLSTSGIAYYDVYVATDGGKPHRIARSRGRSLRFDARPGHTYAFYTVAVDRAGNREAKPARVVLRATG
jgi:serine protease